MPGMWKQITMLFAMGLIALSYSGMSAQAQQGGKIVYLGIGGATQDALRKALFEPFQKETGIQVVEDTGLGQERVEAEVKSGRPSIDFLTTSTNTYLTFLGKDLLASIDYKYYDPADIKSMPEATRLKFAVDSVFVGLVMAFSKQAFPDGKPQPQSWADFWDVKKFPGKRTLPYCDVLEGACALHREDHRLPRHEGRGLGLGAAAQQGDAEGQQRDPGRAHGDSPGDGPGHGNHNRPVVKDPGRYCSSPLQWNRCSRRCANGETISVAQTRNTSPAYSAYAPANSLPAKVIGVCTGPMPPSSIAASTYASMHDRPSNPT